MDSKILNVTCNTHSLTFLWGLAPYWMYHIQSSQVFAVAVFQPYFPGDFYCQELSFQALLFLRLCRERCKVAWWKNGLTISGKYCWIAVSNSVDKWYCPCPRALFEHLRSMQSFEYCCYFDSGTEVASMRGATLALLVLLIVLMRSMSIWVLL